MSSQDSSMLPLFKKTHISSRSVEDYVTNGYIRGYSDEPHKRNALRQAGLLYRMVNGELYRHGTEKEYARYGLRIVIHDDEADKKSEIIRKSHVDELGNHYGMNITLKNVTETYFWQGISSHIKMFMKTCEQCKLRSKLTADEWIESERENQARKKSEAVLCKEAKEQIKNLGRIKKATPPETFFIVNAEKKKTDVDADPDDINMMIDSNNIEYVVETLGHTDGGIDLPEICHVMNVPDIVPMPERFRSREIENFLKYGSFPPDFTANQRNGLKNPASQYSIIDGEMYHDFNKKGTKGVRQVIHDDTPALKVKIIVENHMDEDGSHCGMNKTLRKISEKYYWNGLSIDTRRFMMHCKMCNSNRARKALHQDAEQTSADYLEQVEHLKNKHEHKMSIQEPSHTQTHSQTQVEEVQGIAFDETEGTEVNEVQNVDYAEAADSANTYNQVIRLIGPNKEVTEITVAVVKSEGQELQTEESVSSQETGQIQELVVEQDVEDQFTVVPIQDSVENVESMECIESKDEEQADTQQKQEPNEVEVKAMEDMDTVTIEPLENSDQEIPVEESMDEVTGTSEIMEEDQKNTDVVVENDGAIGGFNEDDADVGKVVQVHPFGTKKLPDTNAEGEMMCVEDSMVEEEVEEYLEVVVINEDGREERKMMRREELDAVTELVTVAEEMENQKEVENENIVRQTAVDCTTAVKRLKALKALPERPVKFLPDRFSFYKDIIYFPKTSKTTLIEEFLKTGVVKDVSYGRMVEISLSYQLVDGVLYRKHTRYKSGQQVIHDDNPELKMKLMERYHKKPNGAHCSGKVTYNKLSYEYFWEEMRWDVHRYFNNCGICVVNGVNLRTKQHVRTAEDERKILDEIRMKNIKTGRTAAKSREFRERVHDKLETFKQWEKFGKPRHTEEEELDEEPTVYLNYDEYDEAGEEDEIQEQRQKVDGTLGDHLVSVVVTEAGGDSVVVTEVQDDGDVGEESDVEIHIPDDDDDDDQSANAQFITVVKKSTESIMESPKKSTVTYVQKIVQKQHEGAQAVYSVLKDGSVQTTPKGSAVTTLRAPLVLPTSQIKPTVSPLVKVPDAAADGKSSVILVEKAPGQASPMTSIRKVSVPSILKYSAKSISPEKTIPVSSVNEDKLSPRKNILVAAPLDTRNKKPTSAVAELQISPTRVSTRISTTVAPAQKSPAFVTVTPATGPATRRSAAAVLVQKPVHSPQKTPARSVKPTAQSAASQDQKAGSKRAASEVDTPTVESSRPRREIKRPRRYESPDRDLKHSPAASVKPDIIDVSIVTNSGKKPKQELVNSSRTRDARMESLLRNVSGDGLDPDKQGNNVDKSEKKITEIETVTKHIQNNKRQETLSGGDSEDAQEKNVLETDEDGSELMEQDESEMDDDAEDDFDEEDDEDTEGKGPEANPALAILLTDGKEKMEILNSDSGYMCSLCSCKFRTEKLCTQHGVKNICYDKCGLCGRLYKKSLSGVYMKHLLQHEQGEKLPCSHCDKVFFDKPSVEIHERVHDGKKVTACSDCGEKFYTCYQLASHVLKAHKKCPTLYNCDVCQAKFVNISFMRSEVLFDGELSYFKCVMCTN